MKPRFHATHVESWPGVVVPPRLVETPSFRVVDGEWIELGEGDPRQVQIPDEMYLGALLTLDLGEIDEIDAWVRDFGPLAVPITREGAGGWRFIPI